MRDIPERFLYHIWDARHLTPALKTVAGTPLNIIFPGHFNTGAGADFVHAVLDCDGILHKGDIEIHLKTSDWQAHQHHEDQRYNSVILHVVYQHNTKNNHTVLENGSLIEILELKSFLDDDIGKLTPPSPPLANREPFCQFFAGLDPIQTISVLNEAGKVRFASRIARYEAELKLADEDQVFYEAFLESLGLKQNRIPFRMLAEYIPLRAIRQWQNSGITYRELLSIFLIDAGLLTGNGSTSPRYTDLWQLHANQAYHHAHIPCEWELFRIRPVNHPISRLDFALTLLWKLREKPVTWFLQIFQQEDVAYTSTSLFHRFHESLRELVPTPPGMAWFRLFLYHAVIPILMCDGLEHSLDRRKLERLVMVFPSLPENAEVRKMKHLMQESQARTVRGSALRQQGLQHLYRNYCSEHECDRCIQFRKDIFARL